MKIYYNNEVLEVPKSVTIKEILSEREDVEHKAVWLNGKHLRLDEFNIHLSDGDHIKVVRIRGGG